MLVLRCSYCGSNLEILELDDRDNYKEAFTPVGCSVSDCTGNPDKPESLDFLKTPERLAYEAVFGDQDVEEGIYIIEDGEENE